MTARRLEVVQGAPEAEVRSERAPPRLLFVGPRPDAPGGISQFASNLILSVKDGAEAEVLAFRRLYPWLSRAGRLAPDGLATGAGVPTTATLVPWSPWTWRSASRALRRFRPDLVVVQWWHPLLGPCLRFVAIQARKAGARCVFVCHNARPHERFPFSRTLSRRTLSRADALLSLSGAVARELRELVPAASVEVLAHPANLGEEPRPGAHRRSAWIDRIGLVGGPIVLFFGHVRRYKGLEDLIAAMPAVRRQAPRATLVVAGRFFEPLRAYRRLVERHGVEGAVQLHAGYVRGDEVGDLFRAADLIVLPYRSASQSGIVAQAALYGRPVVATDVGGLAEAVGDRGILVPPADPSALADGIARALADPPPPPALPAMDWRDWGGELLALAGRGRPGPVGAEA